MKKEIKAVLSNLPHPIKRVALSGIGRTAKQYDDNVLRLVLRVVDGPEAWVDRFVFADLPIADLIRFLPDELRLLLHSGLDARNPVEKLPTN